MRIRFCMHDFLWLRNWNMGGEIIWDICLLSFVMLTCVTEWCFGDQNGSKGLEKVDISISIYALAFRFFLHFHPFFKS